MLRVSSIRHAESVTIKLEGKLVGPWCDEVAQVCAKRSASPQLRLDLYDLTFADARGLELIKTLIAHGATLDRCSSFVAELLKPECI
jgi:hypothetical protein